MRRLTPYHLICPRGTRVQAVAASDVIRLPEVLHRARRSTTRAPGTVTLAAGSPGDAIVADGWLRTAIEQNVVIAVLSSDGMAARLHVRSDRDTVGEGDAWLVRNADGSLCTRARSWIVRCMAQDRRSRETGARC